MEQTLIDFWIITGKFQKSVEKVPGKGTNASAFGDCGDWWISSCFAFNEHGICEAEFKLNSKETSAAYNANGKQEETETSLNTNELPKKIIPYVSAKKYGKIKEATKIVKSDDTMVFEAEVKAGDLLFDKDRNFDKLVVKRD